MLCNAIGVAAAMLASRWQPWPLVLSSGAVAGVLGGYFALYPRSRVLTLFPLPVELFEVPAVFFLCMFVIVHLPGGRGALVEVAAGLAAGALSAWRCAGRWCGEHGRVGQVGGRVGQVEVESDRDQRSTRLPYLPYLPYPPSTTSP